MNMARYALIDKTSNIVLNVIEWDGVTDYQPPDGMFVNPIGDRGGIGWIWNGSEWIEPLVEPPPDFTVTG